MLTIDEGGSATEGVPDMNGPVKIGGSDGGIVRRPGDGEDSILRSVCANVPSAERLPDLRGAIAIISTGGDMTPTGTPGDAAYKTNMAAICCNGASCVNLPHMDDARSAAGSNIARIGRPCQREEVAMLPLKGAEALAGLRIPDLHHSVSSCGSDEGARWRPGEGENVIGMACIGGEHG